MALRSATRAKAIAITAFGVLSSAAQLVGMGPQWAIPTLAATLACVVIGVVLYIRSQPNPDHALRLLRRLLGRRVRSKLSVKMVGSETELLQVTAIDDEHYSEENISHETLLAWWRAYPRGVWTLRDRGKCLGAIGFWPLKKGPFNEVVRGLRSEHQISGSSIERGNIKSFWYIGGIVVAKSVRQPRALADLIQLSVMEWIGGGDVPSSISLTAIAYTLEGEQMLLDFGFDVSARKGTTTHGYAVFVRHGIDVDAVRDEISGLSAVTKP